MRYYLRLSRYLVTIRAAFLSPSKPLPIGDSDEKTLLATLLAATSLAQAHELWVNAPAKVAADEVLKADLAYGHDYPHSRADSPLTACTSSNRCNSLAWMAKHKT